MTAPAAGRRAGRLTLAVADLSGALLLGSVGGGDDGSASVRPLVAMQVLRRGRRSGGGRRAVSCGLTVRAASSSGGGTAAHRQRRRAAAAERPAGDGVPEVVPLAVLPLARRRRRCGGVLAAGGGASSDRASRPSRLHTRDRRLYAAERAAALASRTPRPSGGGAAELALVGALADADADAADGVSAVVALLGQLGDAEWAPSWRRARGGWMPPVARPLRSVRRAARAAPAAKDAGALPPRALLLPARAVHGDGDCLAAARELRCEVGALGETALVASIDEYVSRITGLDQNR